MASCNTTENGNNKVLKFIDNALAIIKGPTIIGGISFSEFVEEVNGYKHIESDIAAQQEITLTNDTDEFKTIAIKISYPDNTPQDQCFCFYNTNGYSYTDRPGRIEDVVEADNVGIFQVFSQFVILNGSTTFPIKSVTIRNPTDLVLHINYLFTK